jgi:diguanylate cyclase (GGDEF)-like protein
MSSPSQLLAVGPLPAGLADSPWGRFEVTHCDDLDAARERLAARRFDALLLRLPERADTQRLLTWPALSQACLDAAVVLVTDDPTPALAAELLDRGVQDVLASAVLAKTDAVARALQLALVRKRIERGARKAYATDLATGLPNEMQLLEHMSHLLALREREPAPMALLVVRIEGLATAEATHGAAAASALRRKLAVRLRASLRASDVVASVGNDAFAALLAWIDAPEAGERVAVKLTMALTQPLRLAGRDVAVAVSIGVGRYPEHGKDAHALLRQAFAAAVGAVAIGRAGFSNLVERGPADAANDDGPPG